MKSNGLSWIIGLALVAAAITHNGFASLTPLISAGVVAICGWMAAFYGYRTVAWISFGIISLLAIAQAMGFFV